MKTFFLCLITSLISVAGATAGNYFLTKHLLQEQAEQKVDGAELASELAAIDKDLDSLIEFVGQVSGNTMRVYHFVAGHVSYSGRGRGGALYCPECGLIMDLENRQRVLDNKLAELSGRMDQLKDNNQTDTQEFKDGVAEINRITTEVGLLQKHLYRSVAMEKSVSTITNTPATKDSAPAPAAAEKTAPQTEEPKAEEKPADDPAAKK